MHGFKTFLVFTFFLNSILASRLSSHPPVSFPTAPSRSNVHLKIGDGPPPQTFGYTFIGSFTQPEQIVGTHVLSPGATSGLASFFWFTALYNNDQNTIVKYYIDDEYVIEYNLYEGMGIGFGDQTMFGNTRTGKGSEAGGVYNTYQIPFYKNLTVSVTYPNMTVPNVNMIYVNFRGTENLPVVLGNVVLPPTTRLMLYRNLYVPMQALELIDLFETTRSGAVFSIYLSVSTNPPINFWEGCFRVYDLSNRTAVKWWLSTGTEDFFQSGWGWSCALGQCTEYRFPEAGLTYTDGKTSFAAYKFFEQDHFFFSNGALVRWRLGETEDANGRKCYGIGDLHGTQIGTIPPATVTTYTWVYEW
eukprot:TRINITY_DN33253_c0_g1_i1.p2 TRINITY_DN33253_c0_g1~~TRINITY_DN33253_c0_g1_i1.p2  ORF type:complete len:359 (-),score=117.13 TRINITY_DN33253_c0_g1_i1:64-1140(-)